MQTVFFNSSIETEVLTALDEKLMDEMGLDTSSDKDAKRYRYFFYNTSFGRSYRMEMAPRTLVYISLKS